MHWFVPSKLQVYHMFLYTVWVSASEWCSEKVSRLHLPIVVVTGSYSPQRYAHLASLNPKPPNKLSEKLTLQAHSPTLQELNTINHRCTEAKVLLFDFFVGVGISDLMVHVMLA